MKAGEKYHAVAMMQHIKREYVLTKRKGGAVCRDGV